MRISVPPVVGQLFLAGDGFVGFRCECGYIASARSAGEVDLALRDHQTLRHLQPDPQLPDTDDMKT